MTATNIRKTTGKKLTLKEIGEKLQLPATQNYSYLDTTIQVLTLLESTGTKKDNLLIRITSALTKIAGIAPKNIYVPGTINRSRDKRGGGAYSPAFWLDCGDGYDDKSHHVMASVGATLEKLGLACTIGKKQIFSHTDHDVRHAGGEYRDVHTFDDVAVVIVDPTQKDFLPKLVEALALKKLEEFQPETMGESVREEMMKRARNAADKELFGNLIAREPGRGGGGA